MADPDELWQLISERREGVLATVKRDGTPQLSNVLYVAEHADRLVRISTTADRVKARNVARTPRAVLHVTGPDFWHYAVAEGDASLSATAVMPGDAATGELFAVHSAFYGDLDRDAFDAEMIQHHRLVLRLHVTHLYGVMTTAGRRPVPPGR